MAFYVHCDEIQWGTLGDHVAWIGDRMTAKNMDCVGYKSVSIPNSKEVQKLYCFNSKGCDAKSVDWARVYFDNSVNKITRLKVQDASNDWVELSTPATAEKYAVLNEGSTALKRGAIFRFKSCSSGNW